MVSLKKDFYHPTFFSLYEIKFLGDAHSWDLLCDKVFAKSGCPVDMEELGRSVAKKCGGLPLAIVVISGLFAKFEMSREYWGFIYVNVAFTINNGNDERYVKILSLCYSHLPIYIKRCFIYLSVILADFTVTVSKLIKLWVAEGFIRMRKNKTLEETSDINLILDYERGSSEKLKSCNIHHVIWGLFRREAHKDRFVHTEKFDNPNILPRVERERRIIIQPCRREDKLSDPLLLALLGWLLGSHSNPRSRLGVTI